MFNINSFCKKSDGAEEMCPQLTGVHYANGCAHAPDSHILAVVPAFYSESEEGQTIYKDGHAITGGKFPNCSSVFAKPETLEAVTISTDAVIKAAKEARARLRRRSMLGYCYVTTANGKTIYYNLCRMEKIVALMKHIKATKLYLSPYNPNGRAAYVYAGDCNEAKGWGAIMPQAVYDDAPAVAIC